MPIRTPTKWEKLHTLYHQLPGKWIAQAWEDGDSESIRVRDFGEDNGMVGDYYNRIYRTQDLVQAKIGLTVCYD